MKVKKGKSIPEPVNYDFPDPASNDDDTLFGCDAFTLLHMAAEYERWAERARSCGRDDLAILYEIKAEEWFEWYKGMEQG